MSEQNSENTAMTQGTASQLSYIDQIFARGVEILMAPSKDAANKDLRQKVFGHVNDLLISRLHLLNPENQGRILEGIFSENPSAFVENEFWWQYVQESLRKIQALDDESRHPQTGLFVLLNRIKDLKQEVDWFSIFITLSDSVVKVGCKCEGFHTVLGWLVQADSENLRKILYRTDSKSYHTAIKLELYKMAIDLGIFDVKIARRVRSDGSGSLSSDILAYLFENRSLYSDDVFQDLVTQFSDTKHKWVARYIAINMPMHLVPFLMGIGDDLALKIMERRMEVSEDQNGRG